MGKIILKNRVEIEQMREACLITRDILMAVGEIIKPGITTEEIDIFVHRATIAAGATPATLNYKGYPKSVCTSVNEVICHGIPSPYVRLKAGDIINVDVTSVKSGWHGDASRMYFVGGAEACSSAARDLVAAARQALYAGIAVLGPGARVGDIGAAIEKYIVGLGKGYGIVREYTGHGLGRNFHEPPQVLHYGKPGNGARLEAGMTFTIEPMINQGTAQTTLSKVDGWTVRTADGKLSAQWEHTVCITTDSYEILTQ